MLAFLHHCTTFASQTTWSITSTKFHSCLKVLYCALSWAFFEQQLLYTMEISTSFLPLTQLKIGSTLTSGRTCWDSSGYYELYFFPFYIWLPSLQHQGSLFSSSRHLVMRNWFIRPVHRAFISMGSPGKLLYANQPSTPSSSPKEFRSVKLCQQNCLPLVSCMTMELYFKKVISRLLVCTSASRGSSTVLITEKDQIRFSH